jgi:hypothetical protein
MIIIKMIVPRPGLIYYHDYLEAEENEEKWRYFELENNNTCSVEL